MWRSIAFAVCFGSISASAQDVVEPKAPEVKDYDIAVNPPDSLLKLGDAGRCSFTIRPHLPWTLKPNTPFEGTVTSSGGLELVKTKLSSKDFADAKPADKTLLIPFNVREIGPQRVGIEVTFFLCTDEVCQRYKESIECKY